MQKRMSLGTTSSINPYSVDKNYFLLFLEELT